MYSFNDVWLAGWTTTQRCVQNFYLPNLDCHDSKEEMILFQSEANSPSYIHFNNDTFKLETNSNILFKSSHGKWKAIAIPFIRGKCIFIKIVDVLMNFWNALKFKEGLSNVFFVFLDDPKRTCNALSKSLFIKRYSPTTSVLSSWEGATGTCIFPFYWKGHRYDYCANPRQYGGNGFCSFTTNFVGKGGWCTNECPLGRQIC